MDSTEQALPVIEFLSARLDEAEVDARAADRNAARFDELGIQTTYSWAAHRSNSGLAFELGAPSPSRVLADIASKRRIIAEVQATLLRLEWSGSYAVRETGRIILHLLAEPFSGHADYRQAWALSPLDSGGTG